jgi:hypothetical protein
MRARSVHLFGRRILVAGTLGVVLAASVAVWAAGKDKDKAKAAAKAQSTPAAEEAAGASKGETVHIYLQTVPPRKAQVKWGGKNLGLIPTPKPLIIERPRDSGPLDLVIRASGYLPVHTRAYTFSDSRVSVKLTPPTEKNKLFGYKQEPVANPDGGPPPAPGSAMTAPATPAPTTVSQP